MAVLRKDNIDDSCICVLSSYSSHAGERLFLSWFGGVGWPSSLICPSCFLPVPPSPTAHPTRHTLCPRRALQGTGITGPRICGKVCNCKKTSWVSWRRGVTPPPPPTVAFRKLAPESELQNRPKEPGHEGSSWSSPSEEEMSLLSPAQLRPGGEDSCSNLYCSRLKASFILLF